MPLFSSLYAKTVRLAGHRRAPWFLAGLSFSEASFFPIPPDVLLAPMALAKNSRAWQYALITTIASVLGGILGYFIGMLAFEAIEPLLHRFGYWHEFQLAQDWFDRWGFWALFLAGFSPIPYKVFTIAAGVVAMAFAPFLIASAIGRGARFFLVAAVVLWGGPKIDDLLRKYIDLVGWVVVILAVIAYFVFRG